MGLRKVFEARDTVWYRTLTDPHGHLSPTSEPSPEDQARGIVEATQAYYPADFEPRRWGFESCRATYTASNGVVVYECAPVANPDTYEQDLRANGRIYGEELSGLPYAAIWADSSANPLGPSSIHFFGKVRQVCYPSGALARWTFDGRRGVCLYRSNVSPSIEPGGRLWYEWFVSDPTTGDVWTYGVGGLGFGSDVAWRIGLPESFDPDGVTIRPEAFPEEYTEGISGALAFAICLGRRRVAVTHTATNQSQMILYEVTADGSGGGEWGFSYVRTLYLANRVKGAFFTHDGILYVRDVKNFLHVFGHDGESYQGTIRHVPIEPGADAVFAWDRFYRRIVSVEGTANEADGASTLRPRAFYPVPEPTRLSAPIPLQVPRRGRTVSVLAQVTGDGVEPISSLPARLTGTGISQVGATDRDGDAIFRVTFPAVGPVTLTATV